MYSTHYSCPILMKLEFSQNFFEKYSNIKFHENVSSGNLVVPCGQMDGRNFVNVPIITAAFFHFSQLLLCNSSLN